jgi:GDP-L-fucose synthase
MVGSAIVRRLAANNIDEIVTQGRDELDLRDQSAVRAFFQSSRLDQIYLAAAKVGGIHANNSYPADFIYDNLVIQTNVIHEAFAAGITRLLFLGSSCIYPARAEQPMREDALLTGPLEPTNEPYAIAKIAGIKMCESYNRQYGTDYRSVMPTNLYGPGDNYHPENSHVLPALIRRFCEARRDALPSVTIWGTGTPRREFLHVDDMAAAAIHVMNLPTDLYRAKVSPMQSHINVGYGEDVTILDLARMVARIAGYEGEVLTDTAKPDGPPRKLMDSSLLLSFGWSPEIPLEDGIKAAVADFELQRRD